MSRLRPSLATLTIYSRRIAVAVAGAGLGVVVDRLTRGSTGIQPCLC